MPFIKGNDSDGNEWWLNERGYWAERESRCNFTPAQALTHFNKIRSTNSMLKKHERIDPEYPENES